MTQKIITITREYGSGGRLIAKKVAEALNIAFYDNERRMYFRFREHLLRRMNLLMKQHAN